MDSQRLVLAIRNLTPEASNRNARQAMDRLPMASNWPADPGTEHETGKSPGDGPSQVPVCRARGASSSLVAASARAKKQPIEGEVAAFLIRMNILASHCSKSTLVPSSSSFAAHFQRQGVNAWTSE